MRKRITIMMLVGYLFFSLFQSPSFLYAQENLPINITTNQSYDDEQNVVNIEVKAEAQSGYEITALEKEERERVTQQVYSVRENGNYTFTVYYKEINTELEQSKQVSVVVDSILNKDVLNQPEEMLTTNEETSYDDIVEEPSVGIVETARTDNILRSVNPNATDSQYFIFGSVNTITGYTSDISAPKDIVIPEYYIDSNGIQQEVLHIADNAFSGQQLTSILLNDNLQTIGKSAFANNIALSSVSIPGGVEDISASAFAGCSGLTDVTICPGVKTIGASAFSGNTKLKNINIANTVTKIEGMAFYSNTALEKVVIPDSVTSIAERAFYNCRNIKDISFGAGITEIDVMFFSGNSSSTLKVRFPTRYFGDKPAGGNYDWGFSGTVQFYWKSDDNSCFYVKEGTVLGMKPEDHENCQQTNNHTTVQINNADFGTPITKIGNDAFNSNRKITTVQLPDTVQIIGEKAFYYNSELRSVNLGSGIEKIEANAFAMSGISQVDLTNVKELGEACFSYCTSLSSVTLDANLTSMGPNAFSGTAITTILLPDSLKTIPEYAFSNCSKLVNVTFGNDLETISNSAFSKTAIEHLTIPNTVTTLGNNAFNECKKLTSVSFDNCTLDIGEGAFGRCETLTNVDFGNNIKSIGSTAFYSCRLTTITIPNSVTSIGERAFANGMDYITNITIGTGIETIGEEAFDNENKTPSGGVTINLLSIPFNQVAGTPWGADNARIYWQSADQSCFYVSDGVLYGFKPLDHSTHTSCAQGNDHSYIDLTTQAGAIKNINEKAFSQNTALKSINLAGVETIGNSAFEGCTALTKVDLDTSLKSLGESAFEDCIGLRTLILNEGLETLGDDALYGTRLTELILPNSVTHFGDWVFPTTLTKLTIGEGVTTIGEDAFNSTKLKIYLPTKSINEIPGAPWGANEKNIYWKSEDNSCFYILDGMIYGLKPIDHPTHLCNQTSGNHTEMVIDELINGEAVTGIAPQAFMGNTTLKKITIPKSVKVIGDEAFSGCTVLKSVQLDEGLETIGKSAFTKTIVDKITIPNSVKEISEKAFYKCPSLIELTLGNNLETIGINAFDGTSIKDIVIPGSVSNLGDFAFANTNSQTVTVEVGIEKIPTSCFMSSKINLIILPDTIKSIGETAFYNCQNITVVDFGNSVNEIGSRAFSECIRLKNVQLPAQITQISGSTFEGCTALETVDIPEGVTNIGSHAFDGATALKTLTIPTSVLRIENYAFKNCTGLKEIFFTEGLEVIGTSAFEKVGISKLTLPDTLTLLKDSSFARCPNLESVVLGKNVDEVQGWAFEDCGKLNHIELNDSLTVVGYAIVSGSVIEEITIPLSVQYLDESLAGATEIKNIYVDQLRDKCSFQATQPWGADNSAKVHYWGEFINGEYDVVYNEDYSKATIQFKMTSFDTAGTIKHVILPNGNKIDNIDQYSYTFEYPVSKNDEYTFTAHPIVGVDREFKVVVDRLIPLNIDAHNARVKKDDVASLSEADIIAITEANAHMNNPIDETLPNKEPAKLMVDTPSLDNIKAALTSSLTSQVTFRAEGTLPGDATVYTKEKTVTIRAVDEHKVEFVDYKNDVVDTQYILTGNDAILRVDAPSQGGYHFTGWEENYKNIQTDTIVYAKYEKNIYNVDFVDWNNQTLKSTTAEHGTSVVAPSNPNRTGYTFAGWDQDFSNVVSDLTIKAKYAINQYTVKFVDYNGTLLKTQQVDYGTSAEAPSNPNRTGHTFASWDQDFSSVVSNLTITAQYDINRYTVNFVDYDGTLLKTQQVKHAKGAIAPENPNRTGYIFTSWDMPFDKVVSNMQITAQYVVGNNPGTLPEQPTPPDHSNQVSKETTIQPNQVTDTSDKENVSYYAMLLGISFLLVVGLWMKSLYEYKIKK